MRAVGLLLLLLCLGGLSLLVVSGSTAGEQESTWEGRWQGERQLVEYKRLYEIVRLLSAGTRRQAAAWRTLHGKLLFKKRVATEGDLDPLLEYLARGVHLWLDDELLRAVEETGRFVASLHGRTPTAAQAALWAGHLGKIWRIHSDIQGLRVNPGPDTNLGLDYYWKYGRGIHERACSSDELASGKKTRTDETPLN